VCGNHRPRRQHDIEHKATRNGAGHRNRRAKPTKKARVTPRRAHVASKNAKAGNKASSAKKAPKSRTKTKGVRDGSKTARIIDLLRRPGGVTAKQLMKATGWQPHSVRGFLSGTVGKKMGLVVRWVKREDGERSYSVKA
jgi:hypothetical protein